MTRFTHAQSGNFFPFEAPRRAWRLIFACALAIGFFCPGLVQACGGQLMKVEADGPAISSTLQQLANRLDGNTALAIGERHGVEEHPRAAGCFLANLSQQASYALILEHLEPNQQIVLDQYRLDHPEIVDGLGAALKWWALGWPAWTVYKPLFETAWLGRAPIFAGDAARSDSIPSIEDAKSLHKTVGVDVAAEWATVMSTAHCGHLDSSRADALGRQQMGRDLAFVAKVRAVFQDQKQTPVLYAGRSHVRNDRSVPLLLTKLHQQNMISVALQETHVLDKPVDKERILAEAKGRYDYVWFVGKAHQSDPCDPLKKAEARK